MRFFDKLVYKKRETKFAFGFAENGNSRKERKKNNVTGRGR